MTDTTNNLNNDIDLQLAEMLAEIQDQTVAREAVLIEVIEYEVA